MVEFKNRKALVVFQAERAEKEKMKKVVLGFHERQEEEDYQGSWIFAIDKRPEKPVSLFVESSCSLK